MKRFDRFLKFLFYKKTLRILLPVLVLSVGLFVTACSSKTERAPGEKTNGFMESCGACIEDCGNSCFQCLESEETQNKMTEIQNNDCYRCACDIVMAGCFA